MELISLNDFVDNIYCINLIDRKDRWELISKEFDRLGMVVQKFDAVNGETIPKEQLKIVHDDLGDNIRGAQGAIKSHRNVLKDAIDKGYERIAVFEDDLIFCQDFLGRFNYYKNNIPKDWDMMYLGCHFHGCPDPERVGRNIYKNKKNFGCFAMIMNKNLIEYIYDYTKDEEKAIDDYVSELAEEFNFYSFIPFFVKTTFTVSDVSITNDAFEYDIVNKYYSDYYHTFNPYIIDSNKTEQIKKISKSKDIQVQYNVGNILNRYVNSPNDFLIYKDNGLIFDSKSNKQNISVYKDYFVVYGKSYDYNGVSIKNK